MEKENIVSSNLKAAIMICTLFTGQTSKEGIFMRYSFEFKMMCVELYKQGKWPETPSGVKPHTFHTKINVSA